MWALNNERVGGRVDAHNSSVELIDITFRIARAKRCEVEYRGYLAGDLSSGVYLDRLPQIEIKPECIHVAGVDDKGAGQIDGDNRLGKTGGSGGDRWCRGWCCVEITKGCAAQGDGCSGVSAGRDGVEIKQRIESVEACKVDSLRAIQDRNRG